MFFSTASEAATSFGILGGAGTALTTGVVFFKPIARTVGGFASALVSPFRFNKAMRADIQDILSQLKPNGGSSLCDAVNQLVVEQQKATGRQLSVMEHLDTPVFEVNADGGWVWVNSALCRLTCRQSADLEGANWINAVLQEDRPVVSAAWLAAIADQRGYEATYRLVSGHTISVRAEPFKNPKGRIPGWLGFIKVLP